MAAWRNSVPLVQPPYSVICKSRGSCLRLVHDVCLCTHQNGPSHIIRCGLCIQASSCRPLSPARVLFKTWR